MKIPQFDIVVVGAISTDYLSQGLSLPASGEESEARAFVSSPGGRGLSQAIACARLGAKVRLIGRLGRDERGDEALRLLEAEGIDTRHVSRDPVESTGASLRLLDQEGRHQMQFVPGANSRLRPADVRHAAEAFQGTRVLLVQLGIPLVTVMAAIGLGVGCGARIVLDPSPAPHYPLPDNLLRLTDLIRLGREEAAQLTGAPVQDRASARIAGERLLWRGAPAALVEARGGHLLMTDDRESWFPNLPVEVVDATGGRDAMAGGIAVALSEGHAIRESVLLGRATSALTRMRLGGVPALPRRDRVLELLGPDAALFESHPHSSFRQTA